MTSSTVIKDTCNAMLMVSLADHAPDRLIEQRFPLSYSCPGMNTSPTDMVSIKVSSTWHFMSLILS